MNDCYDDGTLRAFLDGEPTGTPRAALRAHLEACPACRARASALQAEAERTATLLHAPQPDAARALAQVRAATRPRPQTEYIIRRDLMITKHAWRRRLTAAAAVMVALSLLLLPPVQAAANQFLSLFRVQSVVFVPVSRERMEQLEQLDFDQSTLFVAEPEVVTDPGEPQAFATADEAAAAVGFTLAQPALPGTPAQSEYHVQGRSAYRFQVNVESARQLLQLAGVNDISLPDSLGAAPITAEMEPVAMTRYIGADYSVTLVQGRSPTVSLPEGVDLAQLGTAALRLLGMSPSEAAAVSSQVDWSTTFVFPFPADMTGVRQVEVGGVRGLLISSGERGERQRQIYWQQGERFFVLSGAGDFNDASFLALAQSVK
jgi:hypothetical protein